MTATNSPGCSCRLTESSAVTWRAPLPKIQVMFSSSSGKGMCWVVGTESGVIAGPPR